MKSLMVFCLYMICSFSKIETVKISNSLVSAVSRNEANLVLSLNESNNRHFKIIFDEVEDYDVVDVSSKNDSIWSCDPEGYVAKWEEEGKSSVTYFSDNNYNVKCSRIGVDDTELPWVITTNKKVAALRRVHSLSYLWVYYADCGIDIACSFEDYCYFISCKDGEQGAINRIDKDSVITNITDKKDAIKINIGRGIEGDAIFTINNNKEVSKFESDKWTKLPFKADDLTFDNKNEMYYVFDKKVYKITRENIFLRKYESIEVGNAYDYEIDEISASKNKLFLTSKNHKTLLGRLI